jgi:hypothetical protein
VVRGAVVVEVGGGARKKGDKIEGNKKKGARSEIE